MLTYAPEGHKVFGKGGIAMPSLSLWAGIISLIFGIIVMIFPKILNYLIGIYLIVIGIIALITYFTK
jgi:uncharacterized membrane protein HdeD (DUF308 family)